MEGLVFLLVSFGIFIWIYVGIQFGNIAKSKGYDKKHWTLIAIFLSLTGYLLIIALPNKTQHEELLNALSREQIAGSHFSSSTNTSIDNDLPEL